MNHRNKVIALLLPFVGLIAAIAIFLDGTIAAAAQSSIPAPAIITKKTAVSPPETANHTAALTALTTPQAPTAACTTPTKILPVGDSITSGRNSTHDGGYRLPLYLELRDDGYDIEMVGGKTNGPSIGFDPFHEGVPGIETKAVVEAMDFYLPNNDPDVILLHLGTNDMRKNGVVTETVIPRIDALLDKVDVYEIANQKTIPVFVAQIINEACASPATPKCQQGHDNTIIINAAIEQLVNDRIAATGDNLILVDMENDAGLDYTQTPAFVDFADELHPNDIGYAKMAAAWADKLDNILPAPCSTPPLILGDALTETAVLARYSHQITASGVGNKTYALNTFPTGMTMDSTGFITWIPTIDQVGSNNVEVQVTTATGSDTYAFNINVINAGVSVLQEPYVQTVLKNNPFTFTVSISNTGALALTDLNIDFPYSPSCDTDIAGPLAPNSGAEITCNIPSASADFTHPVYITAFDTVTDVFASDLATISVIDPQLTVVKTAVSDTILYNSTANFTVTVTNTGDVNLTNVEVVDLDTPNCNNDAIGTLTVGQSTEYTCSFSNATVDIDATATATGTHQLGQINANDSAIVDVINPSIALSITPDEQQILSGDNVNFSVTVTNTGNVTLSNVVVTDTIVAGCAKNDIGSLAKDASTTYPCSDSSVTGDYFNNASVTADHTIGQVSDNTSALVDVFNANVDVSMTANTYALSGSNVTFNVLITNTSGTTMDNIQFDDTATGCSFVVSTLADGAHHNANCVKSGATIDLNNTAYVTGTLPSGNVSSSDVAVVDVIDPDINISITPNTQEVDVGETATFTVTVENTGDTDLTNVNVTSTAVSDCNTSIDTTLTAGTDTTHTYTCEVSSASVELDNKVTVVGSHPIGTVTANETAVLELGTSYIFLPLIIK